MKELIIHSINIEGKNYFDFNIHADKLNIKEIPSNSLIKIKGSIENISLRFFVKCDIDFKLKLQCSRCLDYFETNFHEHTEVLYEKINNTNNNEEEPIEDSFTYEYRGNNINLTQMVYDTILLNKPMKPLCNPDCKGIKIKNRNINLNLTL
ncbi:hypothetical protein DRP43_03615 [candidate division TA06 bacterium]|uniref:DUF177 domain-containing protein n=1 Tax=candidate division TA06 bacterium TaxID=2250710 RepID=A0A660SI25_UNCT6|nr:MAG: hypothetical protein DRP43_03615 [candidate division TA06 bacterium]